MWAQQLKTRILWAGVVLLGIAGQASAAEPQGADQAQQLAAAVDQMATEALADRTTQSAGVRIAYGPYFTRYAYRPFIGGYGYYGYRAPFYGGYRYGVYSPWTYPSYASYYSPYVYSPYTYSSFYTPYYSYSTYYAPSYAPVYAPAVYAPAVYAPAPVMIAPPLMVGYGGCYYW